MNSLISDCKLKMTVKRIVNFELRQVLITVLKSNHTFFFPNKDVRVGGGARRGSEDVLGRELLAR